VRIIQSHGLKKGKLTQCSGVAPLTGVIFSKQFNIERTETMMFLPVNPLGNVSEAEASKAAFSYKAYSHLVSSHSHYPPHYMDIQFGERLNSASLVAVLSLESKLV
jgi:hypothetical protein